MMVEAKTYSHFTTILFDLDDTLVDSFRAREDTIRHVFQTGGIALDSKWNLADLRGLEMKDLFRQSGVNEEKLDEFFLTYRRIYWTQNHAQVDLFDGIYGMLQMLRCNSCKLGIVTTKGRDFLFEGYRAGASIELERVGVLNFFEVIVGFEDVIKTKPDPEGINLALTKLNSKPKETIFVGDSLLDMQAASKAGCWSCHAQWGVDRLKGFKADFTAKTPNELLDIFLTK